MKFVDDVRSDKDDAKGTIISPTGLGGILRSGLDLARVEFKTSKLEALLEAKGLSEEAKSVKKEVDEKFVMSQMLPEDEIRQVSDLTQKLARIEQERKEREDERNRLVQELSISHQKIAEIERQHGRVVLDGDEQLQPPPENLYDLYARQEDLDRRILLRDLANSDSPMDRLEAEKYHWITHKLTAGPAQFQNDKWLDEQIEELKRASLEKNGEEEEEIDTKRFLELAEKQRITIKERREAIHARRGRDERVNRGDLLKEVMYPNQFEELIVRAHAEKLLMTSQNTLVDNYLNSRKGRELDLPIADPVVEKTFHPPKKDRRKKAKALLHDRTGTHDVANEEACETWAKYDPSVVSPMTREAREMLDDLKREKEKWVKVALEQWEEVAEKNEASEEEIICDDMPSADERVADDDDSVVLVGIDDPHESSVVVQHVVDHDHEINNNA
ncbi:hypothetical protein FOZ63_007218 [Perkinsus olseni]|uniref:Uncharacterized protein n=2 Tax=Perkinsus olseni TaxID=32597 RepID=A0A7J6UIL2_PEROL|nr:hypothetical protein FOZ63_007218 [Perkinsus olseni]